MRVRVAAGLAPHDRRWSHEDWGRAVQKPSQKQKVQHQGNAQRGSLTFRNAGIKLREHGPLRAGSLYSTHSLAKISKVMVGAEPELDWHWRWCVSTPIFPSTHLQWSASIKQQSEST